MALTGALDEEIEAVARLMKISADDHAVYAEKIRSMIDYFGILDSAGIESGDLDVHEVPLHALRGDEHIPFDGNLIEMLNNYKGAYVRAPSMPQLG